MRIFDKAATGFESGKVALKELKMTPRRYYRNLRRLSEAELVVHFENRYKLTLLGEFMHKLLFNEASTFLLSDQNLSEPLKKIGGRTELRIIDNYKDLISLLVVAIDKSKSEIFLATKYLDMTVIQSIIFALQRDIKIKTVTSEKVDLTGFIKLLGGFVKSFRPNALKFIIGRENNYRSGDVPLSFIIIDDEIAVFEIPDNEFRLAFVSTDKEVVTILSRLFREIWNKSSTLHVAR